MICEIRSPNRLENYLNRCWKNRDVLDLGVKNLGGGIKVFRVKSELKRIVSKNGISVKMSKFGKSIRKLRMRPRSR